MAADQDADGSVQGAEEAGHVYSADGDRLVRREGGATTVYLPGQELTVSALGMVSAKRYYSFAGQTVAVRTGNSFDSVSSIFSDAHNTGVLQVANVANSVTRRLLDPFGAERDSAVGMPEDDTGSSDWVGDLGFLDKPTDGTGLTQVGARYYDSGLGSFVSVDPVMDLADPAQWNAYGYANNNPTTLSDPSGLIPIGAGHTGYNPRQKNDPRKYDRCTHAISCEKTVKGAGGRPVKVRVNYTDAAVQYFSKPAHRTTRVQHNVAHSHDQARAKAKEAYAAKKRAAAAEERRVEQEREDRRGSLAGWLSSAVKSDEFLGGLKTFGTVVGIAAAGACVLATAGACFVVGAVAVGASAATNATMAYRGDQTWAQAGGNFAIDAVIGRMVPGSRAIRPSQIRAMGRHSQLSGYGRRVAGDPEINLPWQTAIKYRGATTTARTAVHAGAGYMAGSGQSWVQ